MPRQKERYTKLGKSRLLTPIEEWEKFEAVDMKSLLSHFRVFLCECYVLKPDKRRRKGDVRGERGVWIHPDPLNRKTSLVYSLERKGTWIWSRSVICNETTLPFQKGMQIPLQIKAPMMPSNLEQKEAGHETETNEMEENVEQLKDQDTVEPSGDSTSNDAQKEIDFTETTDPIETSTDEIVPAVTRAQSKSIPVRLAEEEDANALSEFDLGEVYSQKAYPEWGPVRVKERYHDGDYEVEFVKYPEVSEVYSMTKDEIGSRVEEGFIANTRKFDTPLDGVHGDILLANLMHDSVISNSLQWGAIWYDDMVLPTGEFELGERLGPEENLGSGIFSFLASAAKPSLRGTKEFPTVGMSLAYDVDAALPRFYFQSHGHPLEGSIRKAEITEFQTLDNEDVFRKLSKREQKEFRKKGLKCIDTIWVYKARGDNAGLFKDIKARLALRGDQEKKNVKRTESYAPVMALVTFKILLSMFAADLDVTFIHGDVTAAFVSSVMKRLVYIFLPSPISTEGKLGDIYQLMKALYGGVDAGRCFYDDWVEYHVKELGFTTIHYDKCYLCKEHNKQWIRMAFHVDDTCYAYKGNEIWLDYMEKVCKRFRVKFGELEHFLGLNITRDKKTGAFTLCLRAQVDKLLRVFHMQKCNAGDAPGKGRVPTQADLPTTEQGKAEAKQIPQQQAVGHLQYLQNILFPELSYSVKVASRFNKASCSAAWAWIKDILKWLKGQKWQPYVISGGRPEDMDLTAWTDSNHAKNPDTRKSLGGHVIRLFNDLVDYGSCVQQIVSHSAAESELMALDSCVRRVQYLIWLVEAMGGKKQGPVKVHIDCASVID